MYKHNALLAFFFPFTFGRKWQTNSEVRRDWQTEVGILIKPHIKGKAGQEQPHHLMTVQMKDLYIEKYFKKFL